MHGYYVFLIYTSALKKTMWVFPKNRGAPEWMVYPIKMDDLGENPLFLETSMC